MGKKDDNYQIVYRGNVLQSITQEDGYSFSGLKNAAAVTG